MDGEARGRNYSVCCLAVQAFFFFFISHAKRCGDFTKPVYSLPELKKKKILHPGGWDGKSATFPLPKPRTYLAAGFLRKVKKFSSVPQVSGKTFFGDGELMYFADGILRGGEDEAGRWKRGELGVQEAYNSSICLPYFSFSDIYILIFKKI